MANRQQLTKHTKYNLRLKIPVSAVFDLGWGESCEIAEKYSSSKSVLSNNPSGQNAKSVGSTFYFSTIVSGCNSSLPANLSNSQPELAGKRVLIVDDNATNRKIL